LSDSIVGAIDWVVGENCHANVWILCFLVSSQIETRNKNQNMTERKSFNEKWRGSGRVGGGVSGAVTDSTNQVYL
jgi:hypothetical protein